MKNLPVLFLLTGLFLFHFGYNQSVVNSISEQNGKLEHSFRDCSTCPDMIKVPAGIFLMGSDSSETGHGNEEGPQRIVKIQKMAVSKFDITRLQWAAFVSATSRPTTGGCAWSGFTSKKPWELNDSASWSDTGFPQGDDYPVVCINWRDASDYTQWLRKITGKPYRLLTEAEWEYAARAGTTTAFPWGPTASHEYANYGADPGYSGLISGRDKWFYTSPVGSFPPNAFGLYDMIGNVNQMLEDCLSDTYLGLPNDGSPYKTDKKLQFTGDLSSLNGTSSCTYRVVRGGDYGDPSVMLRSAYRNWIPAPGTTLDTYRSTALGFRVARSLE